MTQLTNFRKQVDQFLKRHPQSPLDRRQQRKFKGLDYYKEDPNLVFEVDIRPIDDGETLEVQTSTGAVSAYKRFGKFTIEVGGESAELTILSHLDGNSLFLPFRDATSGKETYGAGRYMDEHRPAIQYISRDRYRIDFNYSYNPYCAYSPDYSCPLPPTENWLRIPIRAGEKDFRG